MNYRKLGRSGLKVSEVAVGGWLTHGRTIDDAATGAIVRRAFDLGVNFFDTADVYHSGAAEEALGRAVRDLRREDLVIASKCFFPMSERPNDQGLSRKHLFESVHGSLKRLGVEYIDLYQCHRYDTQTTLEETIRAMDDLARQGKILYWGVSEWRSHQIMDADRLARQMGCLPPASNQPVYNMLTRGIETSVIPCCEQLGIGLVVFSPLAQGILTGKYRPGRAPPKDSRGADESSNVFMRNMLTDDCLSKVQKLAELANEQGCTLGQMALAWCLRRPSLSSVIVGATRPEQIEENVQASGLSLNSSVWERAEAILV